MITLGKFLLSKVMAYHYLKYINIHSFLLSVIFMEGCSQQQYFCIDDVLNVIKSLCRYCLALTKIYAGCNDEGTIQKKTIE